MKTFREKQDGVMDNLLRAYRSQPGGPHQVCEEFDPDLANAYIERRLMKSELARYELHLSACHTCRRSVTALARMSEVGAADYAVEPRPVAAEVASGLLARIKRAIGPMAAPQWAVAAAAVIILAVAIPLFLSRNDARPAQSVSSSEDLQARASSPPTGGTLAQQQGASSVANSNMSAPSVAQDTTSTPNVARSTSTTDTREQAATGAGQVASEPAPVASSETTSRTDQLAAKNEAKTQPAPTDETAAKAASDQQVASRTVAPEQGARQAELEKINPEEARRMNKEKDAQMSVLRPGVADGQQRDRDNTAIRPEDSVPQPPPSPTSRTRGRMTEESARSMRQGRLSDSVRSPARDERKVGGRKFWLRGDVWTDKDYNPDKDMPVVTVIRDSENYKELIAKHSSLRTFFKDFGPSDRVIVVYKGIVYKLIPQE